MALQSLIRMGRWSERREDSLNHGYDSSVLVPLEAKVNTQACHIRIPDLNVPRVSIGNRRADQASYVSTTASTRFVSGEVESVELKMTYSKKARKYKQPRMLIR